MRKVDTSVLPKMKGRGANKDKYIINWIASVGKRVNFEYDEIIGTLEIVGYDIKTRKLSILYKGSVKKIGYSEFSSARIGRLIGALKTDFIYEINNIVCRNNLNIKITNRYVVEKYYNEKPKKMRWYKYVCNKCKYDGSISENSLSKLKNCPCCSSQVIVPHINSIKAKTPWMIDLGVGEEDSIKYAPQSNKKIDVICPNCGKKKNICIANIYTYKSICCSCGDGFSYPEKFMMSMLNQLLVDFETQLSKTTFNWCGEYRYDFYVPNNNMLIETHGKQHYEDRNKNSKFKRSLKEEQMNDKLKKELALANGIEHYIVIDCRESSIEHIKNSILNSKLNTLFDLSKIDWLKCEEFALKNIVKEVCDYWNNKEEWETISTIISNHIFNIKDRSTIRDYLKKGSKLGWCKYSPCEKNL